MKLWEQHVNLDVPEPVAWGMFKVLAASDYDVGAMMVRALCDWDTFVAKTCAKGPPLPSLPFCVQHRGTLHYWHQELEAQAFVAKMNAQDEAANTAKMKAQAEAACT